jgi:hypothetical protein
LTSQSSFLLLFFFMLHLPPRVEVKVTKYNTPTLLVPTTKATSKTSTMFGPPSMGKFGCGAKKGKVGSGTSVQETGTHSASALLKKRMEAIEIKDLPKPDPEVEKSEEESDSEPEPEKYPSHLKKKQVKRDAAEETYLENYQYTSVFAAEGETPEVGEPQWEVVTLKKGKAKGKAKGQGKRP